MRWFLEATENAIDAIRKVFGDVEELDHKNEHARRNRRRLRHPRTSNLSAELEREPSKIDVSVITRTKVADGAREKGKAKTAEGRRRRLICRH